MKVALGLTVDGLIRALRGRGHALAETVEVRYRREAHVPRKPKRASSARRIEGRDRDDVAGR